MQRIMGHLLNAIVVSVLLVYWSPAFAQSPTEGDRPNFIVIVADDLGYSDLGSYGGEIATPNIDRLAAEGIRYTNYYVGPTCSPTRSMLMTGMDNHRVGMGNMYERTAPNQLELTGYEGVLSLDVPTFANRLRDLGYRTYMTGKWHLGHEPTHIPHGRGFDRSFSLINSGGSHFDFNGLNMDNEESEFTEDGEYLTELPKDYYSTRTFTEKLIQFIDADKDDDRPFVAYLAYQAPHDPLQVPDAWLRRYKAKYDDGWDHTREQRLTRMKKLGLMPPDAELAPRLWYLPEYDDLLGAAQSIAARKMEIYAAMVEYIDFQVGNLVKYLDESGELDNTVIIFFSDNGPEGNDPIAAAQRQPNLAASAFYSNNYDLQFEAWGRSYGYMAYGPTWAQVSATPFNMYKGAMAEGGIRSPLIVWHSGRLAPATIDKDAVLHVMDIAPTLVDMAGGDPSEMQGKSWAPMLRGEVARPRDDDDIIAMEFQSARMIRRGPWKATLTPKPYGTGDWELFDIANDPAEQKNLSAEHPEIFDQLVTAWEEYAAANNYVLPNRTFYDGMEERLPPRPPVPDSWPRGQEKNWTGLKDDD